MYSGYGTVHPRPYAYVRVMTKPFSREARVCCEELLLNLVSYEPELLALECLELDRSGRQVCYLGDE